MIEELTPVMLMIGFWMILGGAALFIMRFRATVGAARLFSVKVISSARRWLQCRVKHWFDEPWEIAFYFVLTISIATIGVLYFSGQVDWLVITGGLTALATGIIGLYAPKETRIREIAPELVGIAIGVMAIDQLYQVRLEQQERRSLIRQLGSRSNEFALEATRLGREQGWLLDGSLHGAFLENANLAGADLQNANLAGADLAFASFEGADLRYADFTNSELFRANFDRALIFETNFQGAHLEDTDLNRVAIGFLAFSNFRGADLAGTNLRNTYISGANFEGADLGKANLEGADLVDANLEAATLVGANLDWTDLRKANFKGASLEQATFKKAIYSSETAWPEGFDAEIHGAINWNKLTEEESTKVWTELTEFRNQPDE